MWLTSKAKDLSSDTRVIPAIQYATKASIYPPENTAAELTSAQTIIISFLYALKHKDLPFIKTLLEVSSSIPQINSSFLSVWLKDDFCFPRGDVATSLSNLGKLLLDGMQFPWTIAATLASLDMKYCIRECFVEADDTAGQILLSTMSTCVSEGTQVDFAKELTSRESQTSQRKHVSFKFSEEQISTGTQAGLIVQDRGVSVKPEISSIGVQTISGGTATIYNSSSRTDTISSHTFPKIITMPIEEIEIETQQPKGSQLPGTLPRPTATNTVPITHHRNFLLPEVNDSTTTNTGKTELVSNRSQPIPKEFANELLYSAIQKDDAKSIVTAINAGANVNDEGVMKKRPLHVAASAGRIEPAIELIHRGADVNSSDHWGETPLFVASVAGHLLMAEILVSAGANINHRNNDGNFPLHAAASSGQMEIARLLLNNGAEVDCRGQFSRTPLHCAALWGHLSVVGLLLDLGADPMALDLNGHTPISLANSNQKSLVADFLLYRNRH